MLCSMFIYKYLPMIFDTIKKHLITQNFKIIAT